MHDGAGARDAGQLEFHGRPMFPERLHVVALAIDVTTKAAEDPRRLLHRVIRRGGRVAEPDRPLDHSGDP
jgi:hypothetical protein